MDKLKEVREAENAAYRNRLREWLVVNKVSYRTLAEKLGLSLGTVRNWFVKCNASPISEKNRIKIDQIMKGKEQEEEKLTFPYVRVRRSLINIPMICDAAQVTISDFTNQNLNGPQVKKFAKWAASIIMKECKAHLSDICSNPDAFSAVAKSVDGFGFHSLAEGADSLQDSKYFYVPVEYPPYNPIIVSLVSAYCKDTEEKFIAKALLKAAGERMMQILKICLDSDCKDGDIIEGFRVNVISNLATDPEMPFASHSDPKSSK